MKKNNRLHFLIHFCAFALPVGLILVQLVRLRITPFGGGSFLRADMNSQYSAFLTYLRSILHGENDLFYSFSMNGGGNFYFLYTYYLANPLNWFMALVPAEDIPHALTFFILIRFGLAGLTMSLYLRRIQPRTFSFLTVLFSTSYALMAYTLVCAENYFFIDGVVMLPLILIGIEDLIERGKITLYAATLGFMLLIQFYIGWMICLFTVLYFICRWILVTERTPDFAILRRFMLGSLLAGTIAAVTLLPAAAGLSRAPKDTSFPWLEFRTNFRFLDLLGKNIFGAYDTMEFRYGMPGIYSGALVTVFFTLFFISRSVSRKEKLLTAGMTLFLWVSFWNFTLNRIWHGFTLPVWWPYRYSFLFSFWMIRTASLCLGSEERMTRRSLLPAALCLSAAVWYPYLTGFKFAALPLILTEWIFILLILCCTMVQAKSFRTGSVLLSCVVLANLCLHVNSILEPNISDTPSMAEYIERIERFSPVLESIQRNRTDLVRIENLDARDYNDAMRLGYHGLSHYSSTVDYRGVFFPLRTLGVTQKHYWTTVTRGTPAGTASFFGIEAILDRSEDGAEPTIHANPAALPIAFYVPRSIIKTIVYINNPYENLNQSFKSLSGTDLGTIYQPLESEMNTNAEGITYWDVRAPRTAPIYMYIPRTDVRFNLIETVNGPEEIRIQPEESFRLGLISEGENVRVTADNDASEDGRFFYTENLETLSAYAAVIQPRGVPVEKVSSSHLRLNLDSTGEFPYLFLSIFYDGAWRATIDGEDAPIYPALNYFMMIPIEAGTHTIELRYTPPGFRIGTTLSLAGCILLLLVFRRERSGQRPAQSKSSQDNMVS